MFQPLVETKSLKFLKCKVLILLDGDNCHHIVDYLLRQDRKNSITDDYFVLTFINKISKISIPVFDSALIKNWFNYCVTADNSPEAADHLITAAATLVLEHFQSDISIYVVTNDNFAEGAVKNLQFIYNTNRKYDIDTPIIRKNIKFLRPIKISKLFTNFEDIRIYNKDEDIEIQGGILPIDIGINYYHC